MKFKHSCMAKILYSCYGFTSLLSVIALVDHYSNLDEYQSMEDIIQGVRSLIGDTLSLMNINSLMVHLTMLHKCFGYF